jgi:hypothetical protein
MWQQFNPGITDFTHFPKKSRRVVDLFADAPPAKGLFKGCHCGLLNFHAHKYETI